MVKIVINNQAFHCPSDWDDVTIMQIAELRRLTLMLSGDVKDKLAVRYEPSAIRKTDSLQDTSLFDSDWTEAVFNAADRIARGSGELEGNLARGVASLFIKLAKTFPAYRERVQKAIVTYASTDDAALKSLASELEWQLEYL